MSALLFCNLAPDAGAHVPQVAMPVGEESTYMVAHWIMDIVNWIFDTLGISHHPTLELWVYSILVFAISWGIGYITQVVVLFIVDQIGKKWSGSIYKNLIGARFLDREEEAAESCRQGILCQ